MDPPLDKEKHLRYFLRCLRTLLPHQYTSNDSIRMTLGCFTIAAIDLLTSTSAGGPKPILTTQDRYLFREWVLACQHPAGGFAGSPTHALPRHEYDGYDFQAQQPTTGAPGAANIAATYFALQLLALLAAEDTAESAFFGVDRAATLSWLRRLQRDDGSFGEVLVQIPDQERNKSWTISGGRDMRYCYIAAAIRWVLRGDVAEGQTAWVEDINVGALAGYIRNAQTYDGGFSETSTHESHAGYAFCAIAALSLLDRPHESNVSPPSTTILQQSVKNRPALIRWLVSRQLTSLSTIEAQDTDEEDDAEDAFTLAGLSMSEHITHIGFNGRCNKAADTCYCWWVGGTLSILGELHQLDVAPSRAFLLDKTQHLIGGFSKYPGGPPDLYHAYLGLAALATMGDAGLQPFDAALCIGAGTVKKIEAGRRGLLKLLKDEGPDHRNLLLSMGAEMLGRNTHWTLPLDGRESSKLGSVA